MTKANKKITQEKEGVLDEMKMIDQSYVTIDHPYIYKKPNLSGHEPMDIIYVLSMIRSIFSGDNVKTEEKNRIVDGKEVLYGYGISSPFIEAHENEIINLIISLTENNERSLKGMDVANYIDYLQESVTVFKLIKAEIQDIYNLSDIRLSNARAIAYSVLVEKGESYISQDKINNVLMKNEAIGKVIFIKAKTEKALMQIDNLFFHAKRSLDILTRE